MRPWLVLLVTPKDVIARLPVLRKALSADAIDVVQLRSSPSSPSTIDDVSEALILLQSLKSSADGRHSRPRIHVNASGFDNIDAWKDAIDGVHFPERYLHDEDEWRRKSGGNTSSPIPFGFSVHSVESAVAAAATGASYLQVGTMFPTASHPEKTIVEGTALIEAIRKSLPSTKLIGVGGVTHENCSEVMQAGADGVAVIRAILDAEDPKHAAVCIREALDSLHRP